MGHLLSSKKSHNMTRINKSHSLCDKWILRNWLLINKTHHWVLVTLSEKNQPSLFTMLKSKKINLYSVHLQEARLNCLLQVKTKKRTKNPLRTFVQFVTLTHLILSSWIAVTAVSALSVHKMYYKKLKNAIYVNNKLLFFC